MLTDRNSLPVGLPALDGAPLARGDAPYAVPARRPSGRRSRRIRLAMIASWRAAELDRQLAAGAFPRTGTLLAVRGERITSRRGRARVADGLARAVHDAGATSGLGAAVPPDRREVHAARTVLAALDRRLRASGPVTAHGVAMLQELLTDGDGPLYRPREPGALGSRLRAAAAALEPGRRG